MADSKGTQQPAQQEEQQAQPGQLVHRPSGFTLFPKFPMEIRHKILTEAIRKPHIHFVYGKRRQVPRSSKWRVSLHPVPKGSDTSGYRLLEKLASVNREAATAIRLATEKRRLLTEDEMQKKDAEQQSETGAGQQGEKDSEKKKNKSVMVKYEARLPFKYLTNRIDGAEDLVHIQFQDLRKFASGYFHPKYQFISQWCPFDADGMAESLAEFQRVAFTYSTQMTRCSTISGLGRKGCAFRCVTNHKAHSEWKICPEELCGFLNCFPNLREVYILLRPAPDVLAKENVQYYIKNFFTLSSAERRRRNLAIFHDSQRSYIEVHPDLMLYGADSGGFTERLHFEQLPEVHNMLAELNQQFLQDGNEAGDTDADGLAWPNNNNNTQAAFWNNQAFPYDHHQYRLPREDRERLVFKVLVASDGVDAGWGDHMCGQRFRKMSGLA